MKYFSMFSGIGGFELGIQKAYESNLEQQHSGAKSKPKKRPQRRIGAIDKQGVLVRLADGEAPLCVGYSEIDKYAIQIYEKHFAHKNFGDATKIKADELPDFDLLVGGFPCQAFSIAGKRHGFEDTRGTLFFDIARILKAKRPRNFVLENVKGLLSHGGGRTFKIIITTLTELGYCVEWQVLNAKDFGVPQNRERVFIVGHLGGIPERKVFPIGENGGEIDELSGHHANTLTARYEPAQATGTYIGESELNAQKTDRQGIRKRGTKSHDTNSRGGSTHPADIRRQPLRFLTRNQKNIEGDYAFTVDSSNTSGVKVGMKIRRLTPLECERLMGYPDGWTEDLSDTQRYKTLGNGVVSNVVAEVIKSICETSN